MDELRTRARHREAGLVAALTALGVVAGIAAKAADESGWRWAADLGTYPAVWVLAVAVIGRNAPTARAAAVRSALFFATMTAAYYGWAVWVLGFGYEPDLVLTWLVLSATAVAAVAAVSWWATRHSGPVAGALMALIAGTALAGGAVRGVVLWWSGTPVVLHPVQAVADVLVAAVVVLALPRHGVSRAWAAVLVVPLWWLAAEVLDRLLYGTGLLR